MLLWSRIMMIIFFNTPVVVLDVKEMRMRGGVGAVLEVNPKEPE